MPTPGAERDRNISRDFDSKSKGSGGGRGGDKAPSGGYGGSRLSNGQKALPGGGGTSNFHDPFGGTNLDRRGNYKGNPFGRPNTAPAAVTPNYPHTSPSVPFGALVDALGMASPLGMAGLMGRIGRSVSTGQPMSSGWGMDAALAAGGSLGPQSGFAGVGHDWSMDHELGGGASGLLSAPTKQQTVQPTQIAQMPIDTAAGIKKRAYALGLNGVPGPTPYNYQTAFWL